jgi:diguanylate cyclase (GGDEF)-like protein
VEHPERFIAGSLCLHATLILLGAALSGGLHSPLLPWVAIPVLTAAARFRLPVFLIGAMLATVGLAVVAVLGSPHELEHNPTPLLGFIVLLGTLVVAQQPVLNAELRWRRDAVLDPLTGLLNRQGLQGRFREVAEQARLTDAPVSLVMCDLDGFKGLNDEHGHACGDAVLKDVAYVLRKELRSFELLYRVGGEELLLVLPGAGLRPGCEVAEHVRATIESSKPAGLTVTASVGCAAPWASRSSSARCSRPPTARSTRPSAAGATASPTCRRWAASGRCCRPRWRRSPDQRSHASGLTGASP